MTLETTTGSTVPRRQLARQLRELRLRAGLNVKQAAEALEWSEAKMWRIETAQTSLRSLDVQGMCMTYGAAPELTKALMGLAKETKAKGWWHAYGDVIPEGFDVYIGLEEAASELFWYESELVPGLLQTEEYARAIIIADNPGVDQQEIARRVQVRMARQALLTRVAGPPTVHVVLNEAILRRPVGGSQVMIGQLRRLAEAATLPTISIRVVPFSAGLHHGLMSGPFVILRFPVNGDGKESEPPTVYVDGFTGDLYLDKAHEVQRYSDAYADIVGSSLDETTSKKFILQAAKELEE